LDRPRGRLHSTLKRSLLPRLFRRIHGFLAIGSRNREFYRAYGVPDERIFPMPYAVDNQFFRSRVAEARRVRDSLRAELGLTAGRPVILYAAKLQRRKRPADLLEAYRSLSPNGSAEPRPYLLYIGDGEERSRLATAAQGLGWSSIRFLGFQNQTELPRFYDLADVFVLPSEYEPWGLAVNEVMNAGRPVIVSERVGAAADLVEDGKNGFIVPTGDVTALATRLRTLTEDPDLALRMGQESARRISTWNFESDAHGLLACLDAVVRGRGGRAPGAMGVAAGSDPRVAE
jgi:glycosyltransferase involved in cell wall biosynthesis